MTKADLVEKMAKDAGISKVAANAALASFMEGVTKTLKKKGKTGGKVTLVGFGTFSRVRRKQRKGRNPQTGASITIPAAKYPAFVAGKSLKDRGQK